MKRDDWTVTENTIRPAGPQDRCLYCETKLGEQHKEDCVIRCKTVKVDFTISMVMEVPEYWDKADIEHHYNDGRYCMDNIIDELRKREGIAKNCLCGLTKAKYVGDATEEDEDKWGLHKVAEIES